MMPNLALTTLRNLGRIENFLFWLFIAGLAWCPLWLGSNRVMAWGINAIVFPGLAIGYEAMLLLTGRPHPIRLRFLSVPAGLFIVVVIWIILQSATWTPSALHHPIWRLTSELLELPVAGSISVNLSLSILALIRLLTAASVFWLSLQFSRNPKRAYHLVVSIGAIGAAYAAYGLFVISVRPNTLLWLDNASNGRLTSTFVNQNHYATYAGIGLIAMMGVVLHIYRMMLGWEQPFRNRVVNFIRVSTRHTSWGLGASAIILAALLATTSRGGFVAFGFATVILLILTIAQGKQRGGIGLYGSFVLILVVAGGIAFGSALLDKLFEEGVWDVARLQSYWIVIQSISNSPILGYGYGTFADVIPMFRDHWLAIGSVWDKAHNTYLEIYQGLGLIFGSMLIACVVLLAFRCVVGAVRRGRNATAPCVASAAALLVAVNALVDFSLQIQAVTLTFMSLLGAGVAQSTSSRADLSD